MTGHFKDHFSGASDHYRRYRPTYPAELFEGLLGVVPGRTLACDVACGNGQVAPPEFSGRSAPVPSRPYEPSTAPSWATTTKNSESGAPAGAQTAEPEAPRPQAWPLQA